MLPGPPLISVIIPVHNRADLVDRAITSVLSQSFTDFELIIVDDGSTDDTAGAISRFRDERIRLLVHGTNQGASAARNTGVKAASGRYCAFLDSDDYWLPNKLEKQLAFMQQGSMQGPISCTHYHITTRYHPQGEVRGQPRTLTFRHMLFGCTAGPGSTMMAERTLLQDIGLYDIGLRRLEDWDLLLRAARKSPINILSEPLSVVHFVDSKISYDSVRKSCDQIRVRCQSFGLTLMQRAILRGTIENELAAAAYRNLQFGRALFHFTRSLLLTPKREASYFARIVRAVWADISRKLKDPGNPNPPDTDGHRNSS
jgi:glycosyltransferase involved in cell wall biosynthesis